jgi:hypothetical protein
MNEILIFGAGGFMGAAMVLLWALDRIEAHREDAENHVYAAWELSRQLGEARSKIDQLEEQTDSLIKDADFSIPQQ